MRLTIFVLFAVLAGFAEELRIPPVSAYSQESVATWSRNRLRRLMELKGVAEGDESVRCQNWNLPEAFMITNGVMTFCVTNSARSLSRPSVRKFCVDRGETALGEIHVSPHAKSARELPFWDYLMVSIPLENLASKLMVTNVVGEGEVMNVFVRKNSKDRNEYYVYKNICIDIAALTNSLEIALGILNAGLPPSERIAVTNE